ncbi:helix-turn-helix transcriptional regulator [Salmonella enterica subsp. enterica serovar Braenderup]|nr:DNA-binding transcriptional activator BglJ [Salmonella enterica subsp. enterica serovar Braenderup]
MIYILTYDNYLSTGMMETIKDLGKVKVINSTSMLEEIKPTLNNIFIVSYDFIKDESKRIVDILMLTKGSIDNIIMDNEYYLKNRGELSMKLFDKKETIRGFRLIVANALQRKNMFSRYSKLTPREIAVLSFLSNGLRGIEISKKWGCSPKTVYTHKYHALKKLGVSRFSHLLSSG